MPSSISERAPSMEAQEQIYTHITPQAAHMLSGWGMKAEHIDALQRTVGYYNGAYKHCTEKVGGITEFVIPQDYEETPLGGEYGFVSIPFGLSGLGRKYGTECAGLTRAVATELHLNGFMDSVRKKKWGRENQIHTVLTGGHASPFFVNVKHVWVSLVNAGNGEVVIVDPSLQRICVDGELGYQRGEYEAGGLLRPVVNESSSYISQNIALAEIRKKKSGLVYMNIPRSDREFATVTLGLGLADDESVYMSVGLGGAPKRYIPYLTLTNTDGRRMFVFRHEREKQNLTFIGAPHSFPLTSSTRNQVSEMLERLQHVPVRQNYKADLNFGEVQTSW